ncbi:hypothetical protein XM25_08073 [Devosia sp. H5989]|nr:hypothetical protein XM25_08073 [Devosia sp. H5989]
MTMNKDGVSEELIEEVAKSVSEAEDGDAWELQPSYYRRNARRRVRAVLAAWNRRAPVVVTEEMERLIEMITPENFHHERKIGDLHGWCERLRSSLTAALSVRAEPVAVKPHLDTLFSCLETFWCITKEGTDDRLLAEGALDAAKAISAALVASPAETEAHQDRVAAWMLECFGAEIAADKIERADRFIEEALELAQATGWSAERGHALVDYVFSRPVGEIGQEVGGVMVTLAALCNVFGVGINAEARREVDRITQPDIVLKIRAKQAAKPTGSALPVEHHHPAPSIPAGYRLVPEEPTREMILAAHDGPLMAADHTMTAESEAWLIEMYQAMLAKAPLQPVATHRHKKRGTEYVLIGIGKMQAENWLDGRKAGRDSGGNFHVLSVDMHPVALYQSVDDGSLWARPIEEWNDGRFEELAAPAQPQAKGEVE